MEVHLADRTVTVNENLLRRVQAIWRGTVVRRKMAAIRDAYIQVVMETEETQNIGHRWRGPQVYLPLKMRLPSSENKGVTSEGSIPDRHTTSVKVVRIQSDGVDGSDANDENRDVRSGTRLPSSGRTTPDNRKHNQSHITSTPKDKFSSPSSDIHSDSTPTRSSRAVSGSVSSVQRSESELSVQNDRRPASVSDSMDGRGDNTSIWDTLDASHVSRQSSQTPLPDLNNMGREELENERSQVAMELLWIQQAIQSRKEYLHLKQQMVG